MIIRKALLGLLALKGPFTGYEIKKFIEKSIAFFYHAGYSQIYPELSKMEKEGLLSVERIEQEARPAKKVYSIAEEGLLLIEEWLDEPAGPPVIRSEFLMQVFFSPIARPEILIRNVKHQLSIHRKHIEQLKEIEKEIPKVALNSGPHFTLRYGIMYSEMSIEWCTQILKEIKDK